MIDAMVLCGFAQRSEYQHDGSYVKQIANPHHLLARSEGLYRSRSE
jgi:hypothetical protein